MRTLFVTDPPPTVEDWLARRHALGQDLFDEVWEGEYHVAAAPSNRHAIIDRQLARILGPFADDAGLVAAGPCNIGDADDFRVPDAAFFRHRADLTWNPTAAVVVEIVSPGDESRRKLAFYHRVGVEEVLIVDPQGRTVEWLRHEALSFAPSDGSALLGITTNELAAQIDWLA